MNNRRPWFTFSVRSAFAVVTVFAIWCGWQVNFVHRRSAMRARIERDGGTVELFTRPEPVTVDAGNLSITISGGQRVLGPEKEPEIPQWRRWLGDEAVNIVVLPPGATDSDLSRAKALFPEAEVEVMPTVQAGGGFF